MRIAFAIVSLFPGGGLQRDCVEIAKAVRQRGADVVVYTCRARDHSLSGDIPVLLLQNSSLTNHGRQDQFALDFLKEASGRFDLVVGFDKLRGLDVIYCADASIGFRVQKYPLLRFFSRYRTYVDMEKDSFAAGM